MANPNYNRKVANGKTTTETLENATAIIATIIASKVSAKLGIELTAESLLVLAAAVKILIARARNWVKQHQKTKKATPK